MDRGEFEEGPVEAQPSVVVKKKNSRGLLAVVLVLGLISVGLGVGLAFSLMNNKAEDKKCNETAAKAEEKTEATADNDQKIRDLIGEAQKAYIDVTNNYSIMRTFDDGVQFSVGDGIIMPTNHSYGLVVTDGSAQYKIAESYYTALSNKTAEILGKYGLKKASAPKNFGIAWSGSEAYYAFYESDSIVCYYSSVGGYTLECADKSWYSEDDKALVLALAKVETDTKIGYFDARVKNIKKNPAGTYETIMVDRYDGVSSFYRKIGGEWKVGFGGNAGIPCDFFDTAEEKEAYSEYCSETK